MMSERNVMEASKFPDSFGKYMHPQLAMLLSWKGMCGQHLCLLKQSLMSGKTYSVMKRNSLVPEIPEIQISPC